MSDNASVKIGCGGPGLFGLCGILGIVFVTLKLCGVIAWSWWLVLAPFWVPALAVLFVGGCVLAIAGVALVVAICFEMAKAQSRKKRFP